MKRVSLKTGFVGMLLISASFAPYAVAGDLSIYEPSLVPSNPTAGHCYARVRIPARYSYTPTTVEVAEEHSVIKVNQAHFEAGTKRVEIKEASVRYDVRQPTFKMVTEQIIVRPAYDKLSVIAPQFSSVVETIRTSVPRRVWKLGNPGLLVAQGYKVLSVAGGGRGGRGYRSTTQYGADNNNPTRCGAGCEIWCLVEVPGESIRYNRRVMSSAGDVRRVPVPAKYSSITKQVVDNPGGVREIPVPAEYKSISVEHLIASGGRRSVDVPAQYGKVNKKTLIASERYEWRRVVCDPAKTRIQNYGGAVVASSGYRSSSKSLAGQKAGMSATSLRSSQSSTHYSSSGVSGVSSVSSGAGIHTHDGVHEAHSAHDTTASSSMAGAIHSSGVGYSPSSNYRVGQTSTVHNATSSSSTHTSGSGGAYETVTGVKVIIYDKTSSSSDAAGTEAYYDAVSKTEP
ncbi:MAG: hypothetical protein COA69_02715 [Robiginitomaculum sp.]|nr:MAG: hypothetical protein COA69_02715 [Robiginitomaculum sp.]